LLLLYGLYKQATVGDNNTSMKWCCFLLISFSVELSELLNEKRTSNTHTHSLTHALSLFSGQPWAIQMEARAKWEAWTKQKGSFITTLPKFNREWAL
jgi:acyl-CoA-binding protein